MVVIQVGAGVAVRKGLQRRLLHAGDILFPQLRAVDIHQRHSQGLYSLLDL